MLLFSVRQNALDGGDERRVTHESELTVDGGAELREARRLSFVRVGAISLWSRFAFFGETLELNLAMMLATSRRVYQTSTVRIVAKFAIAWRYCRTVSVTIARRAASS